MQRNTQKFLPHSETRPEEIIVKNLLDELEKIKIAYFHQVCLITGSAIILRYYIKEINKSKFFPIVILAKDGPVRSLFEKCGAIVEVFFFHTFWTFPGPRFLSRDFIFQLNSLKINKRLFDYVKNYIKPDIIHINDKASISVGISLKRLNIPIVQLIGSLLDQNRCKFVYKFQVY